MAIHPPHTHTWTPARPGYGFDLILKSWYENWVIKRPFPWFNDSFCHRRSVPATIWGASELHIRRAHQGRTKKAISHQRKIRLDCKRRIYRFLPTRQVTPFWTHSVRSVWLTHIITHPKTHTLYLNVHLEDNYNQICSLWGPWLHQSIRTAVECCSKSLVCFYWL